MVYSKIHLNPINVWSIPSRNGVDGAKEAFKTLEETLDNKLKGRKFVGQVYCESDQLEYKASVVRKEFDTLDSGVISETIPGGFYIRVKIKDWQKNLHQFKEHYEFISDHYVVDKARPELEYYKSALELHYLVPVMN